MKDIQQLIKKDNQQGKYTNIYPKTYTDAIIDKESGKSLHDILLSFNMYFLNYTGNTATTRLKVPAIVRKRGLWITYVKYDNNVYTEWYAGEQTDDTSWQDSANWRIGNNSLVGDITISSKGNWIINGTETEFKAVGEKGNTPLLRVANNRLQVSYDLGDTYRDITDNPVYTKFRWYGTTGDTQANNVGRIQASTDEGKTWTNMSNDFTNNLHISRYIGVNESLPTSGIEEGTIYAKGPYYAEDDTLNDNPIYRLWVYAWKGNTLAWQDNGEFTSIAAGIVQEPGDNENVVMSQKATTELEREVIYDVSAHNNGAVFESLQDLLSSSNLSTLIPTLVRCGGMSIRFIQDSVPNSDNKYVQFRYMLQYENTTAGINAFKNAANWQGIEEEAKFGSKNFVSSDGIKNGLSHIETKTNGISSILNKENIILEDIICGFNINTVNSVINISTKNASAGWGYAVCDCRPGDVFVITGKGGNAPLLWAFANSSWNKLSYAAQGASAIDLEITAPANATHLVLNFNLNTEPNSYVYRKSSITNDTFENRKTIEAEFGLEPITFEVGCSIVISNNTIDINSRDYGSIFACSVVPSVQGDVFGILGNGGNAASLWAFVDTNGVVLKRAAAAEVSKTIKYISAPANSAYAVFNANKNYRFSAFKKISNKEDNKNAIFPENGTDQLHSVINGVKFAEQLNDADIVFSDANAKWTNTPSMIILDGVVYSVFYENLLSEAENPNELQEVLAIYNISNQTLNRIIVSTIGDMFDGKNITSQYDSSIYNLNGVLYIVWNVCFDNANDYHLIYKTYDIQTGILSSANYCQFKVGETTSIFSASAINTLFQAKGISIPELSGAFTLMPKISIYSNKYYTGLGCTGSFNCIVCSSNFVTWEFVSQPPFGKAQYEPCVCVLNGFAHYLCRQAGERTLFYAKYDIVNRLWSNAVYIPSDQTRPDMYIEDSTVNMVIAPNDRWHLSIIKVRPGEYLSSPPLFQPRFQSIMNSMSFYPQIMVDNGQNYILFVRSYKKIVFTTFSSSYISIGEVLSKINTLFFTQLL